MARYDMQGKNIKGGIIILLLVCAALAVSGLPRKCAFSGNLHSGMVRSTTSFVECVA